MIMFDGVISNSVKTFFRIGKKLEIKEEDHIKLPAVFGVTPGVYLSFIYGAILLFILFMALVFPGLVKPGNVGICTSEPAGAAVRVDNVTMGYTPCKVFIPQGNRVIEFVLPGFAADRREVTIKGRIFGSLFFPKKARIEGNLTCPNPAETFARSAVDYIYWSAAGEPTESYPLPLSLSEGAYRTGPAARDPAVREEMRGILEASLRYAATKAAIKDLLRAQTLIDNSGLSPSPFTLVRAIQEAAPFAAALYAAKRDAPEASAGSAGTYNLAFRVPSSLFLEAVSFTAVNAGYLEKYGQKTAMPPMLIALAPISLDAWKLFAKENPFWDAENREALAAAGYAEESYLLPVNDLSYPEPDASGISWYAADAYCKWLNAKLPSSLAGWELRLPSEAEWEYAVRQTSQQKEFFYGSLWEWCADVYAPLDFFPLSKETLKLLENAAYSPSGSLPNAVDNVSGGKTLERSVRGGSWINPPGSVTVDTRGALPPETSSPFVGFRPVIVPIQGN